MILYVVPMDMRGFERHNVAVRLREGENPALFMQNVAVTQDGSRDDIKSNYSYKRQNASLSIFGDVEEGMDLQDGDTLLIQAKGNPLEQSVMFEMENKDGVYLTKGVEFSSISIASCMEERLCVCIADSEYKNVMSTAVQVFNKTIELYKEYPAFRNIMVKNEEGETCEQSILGLIATQIENFIKRGAGCRVPGVFQETCGQGKGNRAGYAGGISDGKSGIQRICGKASAGGFWKEQDTAV